MSELSTALIALDGQIGVILNALDAAQLRQSTVLIITAKHGNSPINRAILSRKSTVRPANPAFAMCPCSAFAPCLHVHEKQHRHATAGIWRKRAAPPGCRMEVGMPRTGPICLLAASDGGVPAPPAQSAITATLAAINPTVQISADTAAYVWLKSNATADVLVRPRAL